MTAVKEFIPGITEIPYAGRVYDEAEIEAGVAAVRNFWLTLGPEGKAFEKEFAHYLGLRHSLLVNSGSSANLVALSSVAAMTGPRKMLRGHEVITAAAGFPTTVAPIVQCGFVPVFVDSDPATLNVTVAAVAAAKTDKTKAVMLAHTLGNPFNALEMRDYCDQHELWLIEDNADAAGSMFNGRLTGTFGHISTQSFYPAHHLTMGEGGAVSTNDPRLNHLARSFRDWGRDCWCDAGHDNTCGNRFGWKKGTLPPGYDHKYIYNQIGYNLKPTDIQAAIGRVQLRKLDAFNAARRANWRRLRDELDCLSHLFEFQTCLPGAYPSWFGFMLSVRPTAGFTRNQLAGELTAARIGSRMLFGGNLTRQPAFINLLAERPDAWRSHGTLDGADQIASRCLFIGVYPGLTDAMLDYMIKVIKTYANNRQHPDL